MDTIKFNSKKTKVIAHRGLSGIERENTCPAFVAACNRSYYGIETDVHVTKDNKFVIIHDESTDRISGGRYDIDVEQNDYSAVSYIVLPDLDGSLNRQDIRIPLLIDYIKICKKYQKECVLEIKNHYNEKDIVKLIDEIKLIGYIQCVTFISFDLENCINVRKHLPNSDVQWLVKGLNRIDEIIDILVKNKLNLDVYYKSLTKQLVKKLHSNGIKINCWTCDKKDEVEKLVKMGVDYITSNILEGN